MRLTALVSRMVLPICVIISGVSICGAAQKSATPQARDSTATAKVLKPQTTCPVMKGEAIDSAMFVDFQGKRIYTCDDSCRLVVKKDPAKYIMILADEGQSVETITAGAKKSKVGASAQKPAEGGYYTCRMHPEVHSAVPGTCPKCGMGLVFKKTSKE